MSTHCPRRRVCRRQIYNMKLCSFYGLWHHLGTEMLNADLVHHVGTAKELQWILRPMPIITRLAFAK
jgi:hypothetical protein